MKSLGAAFGSTTWPLPANNPKTFVGSAAFAAASLGASWVMLQYMSAALPNSLAVVPTAAQLAVTSVVAAVVEALSPSKFDNITVFLATLVTYHLIA